MGNEKRFTNAIIGKEMDNNKNRIFSNMIFVGDHNIFYKKFKLACIVPILLLCIIGCSEVPYTGPVLTVDSVDRYLKSTGEDTICLQDGFDSICLKVVEDGSQDTPPHCKYTSSECCIYVLL